MYNIGEVMIRTISGRYPGICQTILTWICMVHFYLFRDHFSFLFQF